MVTLAAKENHVVLLLNYLFTCDHFLLKCALKRVKFYKSEDLNLISQNTKIYILIPNPKSIRVLQINMYKIEVGDRKVYAASLLQKPKFKIYIVKP